MNGLTDITVEEMEAIYNAGAITGVDNEAKYVGKPIRTNMFWCAFNGAGGSDAGYLINATFRGVKEIIAVNTRFRMRQTDVFQYSNNFGLNTAHTILGIVNFFFIRNGIGRQFGDNLVNATIQSLNVDADFGNCAKLSYYTVSEAVKRSSPSKVITWTMHPNIYALLSGTASDEEYTATDHTKEEWMQIATDASAKQISFATTE